MKSISFRSLSKGFTLIELLIVIAIISILTGIIVTSLTSSKSKSRDAQRVSDINQIQLAIEQYFDRYGEYPDDIYPGPTTLVNYISKVPQDPSTKANYDYVINPDKTDYVLHTTLENRNQVQDNSYPESIRSTGFSSAPFHCFDGQNGTTPTYPLEYCISTK